jgi:hypothetical protein
MIERRPDSCEGAGLMAAVYTASILSTAATKRAAPSSVSVVAGPILESLRDDPAAARIAQRPPGAAQIITGITYLDY